MAHLQRHRGTDLGGRGQDQPVQCWESLVETTVSAVTFRERKPSADKEPQYLRLLAQNTEKRDGSSLFPPPSQSQSSTVKL
jgi:hypothetical protein